MAIGDQLLSINGATLLGISQEEAAQKMLTAGTDVHFEVARQAAMHNGLDSWLLDSQQNGIQQSKQQKQRIAPMDNLQRNETNGSGWQQNEQSFPNLTNGRSLSTSELQSLVSVFRFNSES